MVVEKSQESIATLSGCPHKQFETRLRFKWVELPIVEARTLHGQVRLLCRRAGWMAKRSESNFWVEKRSNFQTCWIRSQYILNAYRERVGGSLVMDVFFIHESQIELR